MIELILGGARSGKSRLAEQRARDWQAQGRHVVYVATAHAGDAEMAARIVQHRAGRPSEWRTVEVTLTLANTLQREAAADRGIVVDCLTLWLSNLFFAGRAAAQAEAGEPIACELLDREVDALAATLRTSFAHVWALPIAEPPNTLGNLVLVASNREGFEFPDERLFDSGTSDRRAGFSVADEYVVLNRRLSDRRKADQARIPRGG